MDERYKELIKECSKEYAKMLEEYAIKNNLNSAFDIIKIDNKVKRNLFRGGVNYIKMILLIIEIYMIILILMLTQVINVSDFVEYNTEKNILLSLIISILIIEISYFTSKIFIKNRTRFINTTTRNKKYILEFEIIKTCKKLDGITYDLKLENEIQPYALGTYRFLYRKKLINMKERDTLESLYFIRNKIVHSKEIDFEEKFIEQTLRNSLEIVNKLEKLIK